MEQRDDGIVSCRPLDSLADADNLVPTVAGITAGKAACFKQKAVVANNSSFSRRTDTHMAVIEPNVVRLFSQLAAIEQSAGDSIESQHFAVPEIVQHDKNAVTRSDDGIDMRGIRGLFGGPLSWAPAVPGTI